MTTFDGGSAYPRNDHFDAGNEYHCAEPGMSLRDYFAAKAANGICSHQDTWGLSDSEKIAKFSYELADAMLKERAK